MDRIWLKTDGDKLKALRESSGIDPVELARAVTLTPAHIRQLEDGGDSLFYSQAIKLQVGRRLLRRLGSDLDAVADVNTMAAAVAPAEVSSQPAVTVEPRPAAAPEPIRPVVSDRAQRHSPGLLKPLLQWFPAAAAAAAVAVV
ncbi:MAG: XRE family transcriptional regulator, partial [Betaproteobacteria bacterium]|nr:XRE family transcriptional regulator [Betaproteobacteria bacterium]